MSTLEDILEHHGVKGMKWGVRKDRGHEGEKAKTKKIAKLDKQYEKRAPTVGTWINLHNRAAELSNKNDVDRINNKPQYKGQDFSHDSPLRRQYYNEHQQAYIKNLKQAAAEAGTNASGTRELQINVGKGGDWSFSVVDVKHDALDELDGSVVKVEYDSTGHIVKVGAPEKPAAAHSDDAVAEFLEHFGVKGMKWGVRKRRTPEVTVTQKGKKLSTSGGHDHAPTSDAVRAASLRQRAHASGTHSLSNEELQAVVNRMNLEQNYARLISPQKNGNNKNNKLMKMGEDFAMSSALEFGKAPVVNYANDKYGKVGGKAVELMFDTVKRQQGQGKKK